MKTSKTMAFDPICGMSVDEKSAFRADHDGKPFFFCCNACRQKFLSTAASESKDKKHQGCC